MADDASCLVMIDLQTLTRIKSILTEFGILSGLCCNIEKTVLIPIGVEEEIPASILDLGFEIRQSATILGMEISADTSNFSDSTKKISEKIKNKLIAGHALD